jgi:uncharacterized RmlC-like cupin family protein
MNHPGAPWLTRWSERLEFVAEAVVINLDIAPAEKPEAVAWIDPIHKAP